MKLYLIRHGETIYNASKVYQPLDAPLSELGIKQARFVAERFKNISIDRIISSPAPRAKITAEAISDAVNKEVEILDTLHEIKRPSDWIGKTFLDEHIIKSKAEMKKNVHDPDWHFSDEENFHDSINRVKKCIEYFNSINEENILVIAHEIIIKKIISVLMFNNELTPKEFDKIYPFLKMHNSGITLLEKNEGAWRLITWNDHAHLGEVS